ncbi:MAG: adenylate/guanylate cyclase domain-containing protein [Vicinamibacterales bacterium]
MRRQPPIVRVQALDGRLTSHALPEGETTVGRAQAGLVLDDARISRRHARFIRAGEMVTVEDLGSRNGTFLNGRRLGAEPERLAPNDVLKVGDFTLVFEPTDAIPFADEAGDAGMREVLKVAPADVLKSGVHAASAGEKRDVSPEGLLYELEKKTRVLGLFYELSRTLGSVFSLEDVYAKVMGILMQVTPAARVVIYQRSERGDMTHVASRVRQADPAEAAIAPTQPLRVSRTVFDNVSKQRVSVLLENTLRGDQPVPESLRVSQTHSVMAAPIIGRKGLLGVIYADLQDLARSFSTDDLDLLNAVAVQTGIALDTVRAHEALQREAQAREKYERFLPQQLVDDVLLDPTKEIRPGGARLMVTVLFADLRGFTPLAESTSPEAVVDLLNRFFTMMSEVIFRHGGTLDKYIGDGVMALFGAPYATERDAVKAVRAAIDIQRAVVGLNEDLKAAGRPEIGVGIGINTGPAIVGFIGSETRLDYTAIGDSVNTAARLEHLAQAGQIIISEHTMQAVDASVTYQPLDAVHVKGRTARMQIAEVYWSRR